MRIGFRLLSFKRPLAQIQINQIHSTRGMHRLFTPLPHYFMTAAGSLSGDKFGPSPIGILCLLTTFTCFCRKKTGAAVFLKHNKTFSIPVLDIFQRRCHEARCIRYFSGLENSIETCVWVI